MIAWMVGLALAGGDCEDAERAEKAAAELAALYQADQADHENGVAKLDKLDEKRARQAEKLADLACTGQARFHAGALLYRSTDPELLERAYELGKAAMMDRVREGPWLTAVSFDKWQIARQLPQRFATQMSMVEGRGACLWPIAPDSTDEERARYGLPPVAEAYRRVLDANGYDKEPATAESVGKKKLWCDPAQW